MSTKIQDPLTPQGLARRDAMLCELLEALRRTRAARRRRARLAVAASLLAMIAGGAILLLPAGPPEHQAAALDTTAAPIEGARNAIIEVQTRPELLEKYASTAAAQWTPIDDAALLTALAEIHRPAGLVRSGEKAWVTAAVTDDHVAPGSGDES